MLRPFEFLSMVLIRTRKAFLARLGSEAGDALDALLEASLSYEENHSSSLAGFALWFASEDTEIKRNMDRGTGEVRLMTVHGAKGLESSIVILPDTTSTPRSNATTSLMFVEPQIQVDRTCLCGGCPDWLNRQAIEDWKDSTKQIDLEEHRRLLYVAMTRARDELYVCGYKNRNKLDENSWYALVADAVQTPQKGQSIPRAVESSDGISCWRLGPDSDLGWDELPLCQKSSREIRHIGCSKARATPILFMETGHLRRGQVCTMELVPARRWRAVARFTKFSRRCPKWHLTWD